MALRIDMVRDGILLAVSKSGPMGIREQAHVMRTSQFGCKQPAIAHLIASSTNVRQASYFLAV